MRALAHVQNGHGWRRVFYASRRPASRQVTWELLAQAAATSVPDGGPILLDSARQGAVTFAAACVAQGYLEFLYGASV